MDVVDLIWFQSVVENAIYFYIPLLLIVFVSTYLVYYFIYEFDYEPAIKRMNTLDRQIDVIRLWNPFKVSIDENFRNNTEVGLIVSSEVSFHLGMLWTFTPRLVHDLYMHCQKIGIRGIQHLINNPSNYSECECQYIFNTMNEACNDKNMEMGPCCEVMDHDAKYFTFIIVMDGFMEVEEHKIIGYICVFSLRRIESNLVLSDWTKFTILSDGDIRAVHKVFSPGISSDGNRDKCSICWDQAVSQVIIPCRHACTCYTCLGMLDSCPICRGPIQTFFSLTFNKNELSHSLSALPHSSILARHTQFTEPHPPLTEPHLPLAEPHSPLAEPHSSLAEPHSSLAEPHSSLAAPHLSLAAPHLSLAAPHSSLAAPHSSLAAPPSSLAAPPSSMTAHYSSLAEPHSSLA